MSRIAGVLGLQEEAGEYRKLKGTIQDFWNETFVDEETKKTRTMDGALCDTQTSYTLGLEYGIMNCRKEAGEHLVRKVREADYTVGTGFFGTGLLNQALCNAGDEGEAFKVMQQTKCPSWLYPVTQGATTIWEHWDSFTEEKGFGGQNAMNSFNHYSLGSVLSWMYSHILGIRREEGQTGYRHFTLQPLTGELSYAKGRVATPYGNICSEWKKHGTALKLMCSIPVNTEANVCLPDGTVKAIGSGTHEFYCNMDTSH